jgi:hypothetical protein
VEARDGEGEDSVQHVDYGCGLFALVMYGIYVRFATMKKVGTIDAIPEFIFVFNQVSERLGSINILIPAATSPPLYISFFELPTPHLSLDHSLLLYKITLPIQHYATTHHAPLIPTATITIPHHAC